MVQPQRNPALAAQNGSKGIRLEGFNLPAMGLRDIFRPGGKKVKVDSNTGETSTGGNLDPIADEAPASESTFGLDVWIEGVDPVVDIIALHGLNGHRENTWTTKKNVNWLRDADMLSSIIPNARIMSWGYDANTHSTKGLSAQYLYNIAQNLVSDLSLHRRLDKTDTRPIIFVAHSLGGIVLKSALIHSDSTRSNHLYAHKSIKLSTSGIMFMGTPHQGGEGVAWGKRLVNVASIFVNTNDKLLNILENGSEILQQQLGQYNSISSDFDTKFAYETLPTPLTMGKAMIVVPMSSAVVPGHVNAEPIAINDHHINMVKFGSQSREFMKVAGHLKLMVEAAPTRVERNWLTERNVEADAGFALSRYLDYDGSLCDSRPPSIHSSYDLAHSEYANVNTSIEAPSSDIALWTPHGSVTSFIGPLPNEDPLGPAGIILVPNENPMLDRVENRRSADWFENIELFEQAIGAKQRPPDTVYPQVRIAIFDTGLDMSHPDIRIASEEGRLTVRDFVGDFDNVKADHGCGTHCTSLILKHAPLAKVFAGRVIRNGRVDQETSSTLTKAIRYAAEVWEVDIISLSFGFDKEPESPDLRAAIIKASRNILIFAPAGLESRRSSMPVNFPSQMAEVMRIYSSNSVGQPSSFNAAPDLLKPNLTFPGEDIPGAWPASLATLDDATTFTEQGATYRRQSGTSCSTQIAVAVAANVHEFARQERGVGIRNTQRLHHYLGMTAIFRRMGDFYTTDSFHLVKPWKLISNERREDDMAVIISHILENVR
ncbi:hypothetical protein VTL71DRAFT_5576 [Oculimacula yallundae]|uniref:Peptidase S8/S53 domain-containing protein n=1 Tax=Oculimacula yallundae TaxID=86028 RepID=A0ABR4C2N4_9HELO